MSQPELLSLAQASATSASPGVAPGQGFARPAAGTAAHLGAAFDGRGTNFGVFSTVAERVELCLFDERGREERFTLPESTGHIWHGYLPGVGPGQRYGFRVHGPWEPAAGLRCNPHKLLLDPYARAIEGELRRSPAVLAHVPGDPARRDEADSAAFVPRSVVVDGSFDWGEDVRPDRPEHESIIYETHVKGLTKRHPLVPAELRGTYAGLAQPAVIEHLLDLGVTAVELLPVHHFLHAGFLLERGLRNYWGYDSIGFFAPHGEYSSAGDRGGQVTEFKSMVRALHAAGLEVILDVVYNHTAEGDASGPTLSFRGLDNRAYYRLKPGDPSAYLDFTGTGNTLDAREPHVLQLIMDSLRYWVQEMHVDGFRFDLAVSLARRQHELDRLSSFFAVVHQDPVIRGVKLIAEPWDVGEGGYQVGNFPAHWSEWNGRFRDTVRDLWRGEAAALSDFGYRFTGSADLYAGSGRRPDASVNFVTAHDGFTLADLVSYERKHNEANGEANQDGESHNRSWNNGVEGATDDPVIRRRRARQQRALLATLLLSQGVPMLLGGDELGRTQRGNNNAYCQDNEISWYDWPATDLALLESVRHLVRFRREHRAFRRRRWFSGRPGDDGGIGDIGWFAPDGTAMTPERWQAPGENAVGVFLEGDEPAASDDDFYVAFNATERDERFRLPDLLLAGDWRRALDTALLVPAPEARAPGPSFPVAAHSVVVLRRPSRRRRVPRRA